MCPQGVSCRKHKEGVGTCEGVALQRCVVNGVTVIRLITAFSICSAHPTFPCFSIFSFKFEYINILLKIL